MLLESTRLIKTISKIEYSRLAHIIDSNPKKWKKASVNTQIINDNEYYFIYNGFNKYVIIGKKKR